MSDLIPVAVLRLGDKGPEPLGVVLFHTLPPPGIGISINGEDHQIVGCAYVVDMGPEPVEGEEPVAVLQALVRPLTAPPANIITPRAPGLVVPPGRGRRQ